MTVGIIIPSNIRFSPYLWIYTKILDSSGINYKVISWNRDGRDDKYGIQFGKNVNTLGRWKWFQFLKYVCFIKQNIKEHKFEKLIVFGSALCICLSPLLIRRFNKSYIVDYRDLSIEQKHVFYSIFNWTLKHSYANVISSPGFRRCLPNGHRYYISHNFDVDIVRSCLKEKGERKVENDVINVLTIGIIRDYSSNVEIVKALANNNKFNLQFVGKGYASDLIKEYVEKKNIRNVGFEGYYPKEHEIEYIKRATIINIFMPRYITHNTLIANRFYHSLLFHKPMIVNSHTVQGDYVEKYNLGIALDNCDGLAEKLQSYLESLDYEKYNERCRKLLKEFIKDYDEFEAVVSKFGRDPT